MIENFESKITFEIPTNLDFDKLIRGNNYTLFWQNLQHQHQQQQQSGGGGTFGAGAAARLGAGMADAGSFGFGSSPSSSLFGAIDYSNGSSDYGLLNSLQSFANRGGAGRDGMIGGDQLLDPTYERFIGDVWVGIVLTLMILSSIFCMCSCFLYHKFRQWQRNVLTARSQTLSSMDIETPPPYDVESLPSYTIVSGLPSYQDAIEQLKQKQMKYYEPIKVHRPSVMKLFEPQDLLMTSPNIPSASKREEIRYTFANRPLSTIEMGTEALPATGAAASGAADVETSSCQQIAITIDQPSTVNLPAMPTVPPPPYKREISTISSTNSVVIADQSANGQPSPDLGTTAEHLPTTMRFPQAQKKIDVCHYAIENERQAGRS
ncbi:protein commissureless 2 homolog [Anopheles aquasalis]|uniref:protein commissureless 2 homolog n=1 Tax=Anopheles aquasalis TaxID=42839 RepID=UPI00215AA672|nr:protein commissureless 2 homolog [Anopheles aquasalis]